MGYYFGRPAPYRVGLQGEGLARVSWMGRHHMMKSAQMGRLGPARYVGPAWERVGWDLGMGLERVFLGWHHTPVWIFKKMSFYFLNEIFKKNYM